MSGAADETRPVIVGRIARRQPHGVVVVLQTLFFWFVVDAPLHRHRAERGPLSSEQIRRTHPFGGTIRPYRHTKKAPPRRRVAVSPCHPHGPSHDETGVAVLVDCRPEGRAAVDIEIPVIISRIKISGLK